MLMNILFDVCPKCKGKGKYRIEKVWVACNTCETKGYIMTELGRHLQKFILMFYQNRP